MSAVLPVQPDPRLLTAIDDTRILLDYASETGVAIDPALIQSIVDTGDAVAKGQLTPAQDAAFWTAYASVSKLLAPVSASSLRATLDYYAGGPSLARHAVGRYKWILLYTLVALLFLQIYWVIGTSITGQIQKNRKEIAELQAKTSEIELRHPAAPAPDQRKSVNPPKAAAAEAPPPSASERADSVELERTRSRLGDLDLHQFAAFNLLRLWGFHWEGDRTMDKTCRNLKADQHDRCVDIARYEASIVVLDVLQRYPLALLYGLLGACAYILRTLTSEIRARIYGESSNISFGIRLPLGMVGGMVIAWFVAPETADGLFRTLSPFALAFLAGYSVELLFAAMDRLISAFTDKKA